MTKFNKRIFKKQLLKLQMFALCLLVISCEKFVEVGLPNSQLTSNTVFKDVSTANAAIANLYIQIRDQGLVADNVNSISIALGYYADELVHYGTDGNEYYQNNLQTTNFNISNIWNQSFNLIYGANSALEALEVSGAIADKDRTGFRGEALFMRAYIHFHLLNLYGSIPYVTGTDYQKNMRLSKLPVAAVYSAIIADLLKAKTDLPQEYRSADRGRINRSVVDAMLARVYLYTEDWNAAKESADAVINNTDMYQWVTNLDQVFLNNSSGTLWQLIARNAGSNTSNASNFIFTSGPPASRALSPLLLNAFEPGDLRRSRWIGSVSKGSDTWYYAYKYKENKPTTVSKEYAILFRLEEMYFIRAEAYTRMGNLPLAAADLNKVRNRAGLGNTKAETKPDLLTAIIQERRIEFFCELGHRWFDLKRMGQLDVALKGVKPGWETKDSLWPLPENELRLNPNLAPQNPGF